MVMLADPQRLVIGAYALEDVTLGVEVARPAAFLIAADGTLGWRFLPEDWRVRTSGPAYVEAVRDHANARPK
jgi:hypothetical protein